MATPKRISTESTSMSIKDLLINMAKHGMDHIRLEFQGAPDVAIHITLIRSEQSEAFVDAVMDFKNRLNGRIN